MPTASAEIDKLDRFLANRGEDVVLQRIVGAVNQVVSAVTCRAFVRGYLPQQLIAGSGITQGDSQVTLSPTQIGAAQWPGGVVMSNPAPTIDPRVPRQGDKMIVAGKLRTVQAAAPIYMNGELVRIDAQVKG